METQKLVNQTPKKNKSLLLFSLLGIVILVVIIILVNRKDQPAQTANLPTGQEQAGANTGVSNANSDYNNLKDVAKLAEAKIAAPGANPITKDNKVVTETGAPTNNSAVPNSEFAPKQTNLLEKDKLSSADVAKIDVGNNKFSPNIMMALAGAPTTFSLTSVDDLTHMISFDDPSLSAVAILVGSGQTKAISFNAPQKAGTYIFRCVSPGHADKGETGTMTVR